MLTASGRRARRRRSIASGPFHVPSLALHQELPGVAGGRAVLRAHGHRRADAGTATREGREPTLDAAARRERDGKELVAARDRAAPRRLGGSARAAGGAGPVDHARTAGV